MNAEETYRTTVRLLDEGLSWYPTKELVMGMINYAQLYFIHKANATGDEKLLRPLYRESTLMLDGNNPFATGIDDVGLTGRKFLYPRTCRIYENDTLPAQGKNYGQIAKFVAYPLYVNYINPNFSTGGTFPRQALYTVNHRTDNQVLETYVYFNSNFINNPGYIDNRAVLWYISKPEDFLYNLDGAGTDVDLEIPKEYHIQVAFKAAEMLNKMDAGEMERGETGILQMGQKLTMENLA
jgi:hypothetical protein